MLKIKTCKINLKPLSLAYVINETNNILNLNNDTSVNSNEAKLKFLVEFLIKLSKVNNSLQAKKNVNINFC